MYFSVIYYHNFTHFRFTCLSYPPLFLFSFTLLLKEIGDARVQVGLGVRSLGDAVVVVGVDVLIKANTGKGQVIREDGSVLVVDVV